MKKTLQRKLFPVVLIIFLALGVKTVLAEELIHKYTTNITINQNSSVDIIETIEYDFGEKRKHGIFRTIPIKYLTANNNSRKIKINDLSVLMDGERIKYKKTKQGRNLKIKIGNANKTITGKHSYQISYTVRGALNYFSEHDELYWNVVGSEWEVPIKQSLAIVNAPQIIKTKCFQGVYGSLEECAVGKNNKEEIIFEFRTLQPGEEATIVIGTQKGAIKQMSSWQRWLWFLMDNWILFLPMVTLLWGGRRWWRHGRDPKGRGTIIPYYDVVNNLSVAEASVVMYNKLRSKDISAMIIQLAVKGFIKIKQARTGKILKHTNYIFYKSEAHKDKNKNNKLTNEEKSLLEALFEFGEGEQVSTDNLRDKFYKKISILQRESLSAIKNREYLPAKSQYDGVKLIIVGVLQMILLAVLASYFGNVAIISGVSSLVILIFFAIFMGHRTKKGVLAKEKLLGLKLYLETAEKDRLKFHNAPAKNPQRFEKLLPYAMIFGVEEEWAEQFKDIYKEQPEWYQSPSGQVFNSVILANNLHSFSKTTSATALSSPSSASSGGSGFSGGGSGGGFGGGGGGSW